MGAMLVSCDDDKPFSVAGADDEPHILDPTFPDRNNGALPVVANITRDANFSMELTVTPADFTTVTWFFDGKEVATGKSIDIPLLAGTYELKVVAATAQGKSTSREGLVQVNPLDGDPVATELSFERVVAPGNSAVIYGYNLESVAGMSIGGVEVGAIELASTDEGATYLSYVVPEAIAEGQHRVVLHDNNGNEFGGGLVTVSSAALITSGADRVTANSTWSMTGINLDKIASFDLAGTAITEFTTQTPELIEFTCPALEDGEYTLTGSMTDGREVSFFINSKIATSANVTISSEQTLWSGHHYVSWELPDGDPNKTFNFIGMDVFAGIKAGATLVLHYSIEPSAEYHQIQTTTGWWTPLPGTGTVETSADGVVEVLLTQEALNMIQEQAGFLCVGHGYYVDLITLR